MKLLERDLLARVAGGMKWREMRRSTHFEDRRGWSRWQNRHAPVVMLPPMDIGPRTPNDLPHRVGLDTLDGMLARMRHHRHRR